MIPSGAMQSSFRAAPVTGYQVIVANARPAAPAGYIITEVDGAWIAAAPEFHTTEVRDAKQRRIGVISGIVYSEWTEDFILPGVVTVPIEVTDIDSFETTLLPRLSGSFVFLTAGSLPRRLYPDHAGSISMVYLAGERRAASSPAILLDEGEYKSRFNADLYEAMVVREGAGSWISGTLTAHRGVFRLLANHYLDLATWKASRFWPRPGEFDTWRNLDKAAVAAAEAIRKFSDAVIRNYRPAVTLTAGFDTRLVLASCREHLADLQFFTVAAPSAEMDMDMAEQLAKRFSFKHERLPLRQATAAQMADWDRMCGDVVIEAPRETHPTLRDLTDHDVLITGLFGEIGRCRYYRQDLMGINEAVIDATFVLDRLTIPTHPEQVENVALWLEGLKGQPNSVILDVALHELKLGSWAMPQRSMTNSVRWAFMPFTQRVVFDGFIGVAPEEKDTKTLFWAIIDHLWPELSKVPINKYGDARDYWVIWKKLMNPVRRRRFIRDRFAKKAPKAEHPAA